MRRDDKADLSRWQPRELIASARTRSLADFMRSCESTIMLVVLLPEGDMELASGLAPSRAAGQDADGLGFRTATRELEGSGGAPRDLSSTMVGEVVLPRRPLRESTPRGFGEQTAERLPANLARTTCYVVPISKRSDMSFLQHVSLGRARNHDIVLRHRSVSKFHAWFEVGLDGTLAVKDCDSRNHTFVNEERVTERAAVRAGDMVRFGSVEARVCTAEGIWRLVHG
jgi:hypothetical protein